MLALKCQVPCLTHWGRVKHICVGKLTIIDSDNGLLPGRRQAIIWTNAGIFFIGPLETNPSEIVIAIQTFSFKKMHLKVSSAKWLLFYLGLNVLTVWRYDLCYRFVVILLHLSLIQSGCVIVDDNFKSIFN